VGDFVFRHVARWRSTSLFSPHHSWPGCVSEGAIRDHGLLHDRHLPPAVGCDPIISLINVPKACAAWRSDLGVCPCLVFTNHPCLYIITPSPATPTDLPGLPQTTVVVEPSLFSLVPFLLRHSSPLLLLHISHCTGRAEPFCMQLSIPHTN
jgi:hypothetical protein